MNKNQAIKHPQIGCSYIFLKIARAPTKIKQKWNNYVQLSVTWQKKAKKKAHFPIVTGDLFPVYNRGLFPPITYDILDDPTLTEMFIISINININININTSKFIGFVDV